MADEEDSVEFQKRIARIGVWSSTTVGFGGVLLGIGVSMLFTTSSLSGTPNLINLFNTLGLTFTMIGFLLIMFGFLYSMYLLRKKSQKSKPEPTICHCGNKLPCRIHLS